MDKAAMELEIAKLKAELASVKASNKNGRKDEVLALMLQGKISIDELATKIDITPRNVSSQLSYLRADMKEGKIKVDGKRVIGIGKNSLNKLYLELED